MSWKQGLAVILILFGILLAQVAQTIDSSFNEHRLLILCLSATMNATTQAWRDIC